jgi:hypothetical protein
MPPRFVTVLVEEHDDLPEGCCMRFKLVDEPRAVRLVRYESVESSPAALWQVESREADRSSGVAWAVTVEDSGAGTCVLLYGGARGLRLRPVEGGDALAEPYLLLSAECVLFDESRERPR